MGREEVCPSLNLSPDFPDFAADHLPFHGQPLCPGTESWQPEISFKLYVRFDPPCFPDLVGSGSVRIEP